jgi:hypothetical protein
MLLIAWVGTYLSRKGRLEQNRVLMWLTFLSFPLPFIAILTGWFTAEVGRQPWTIYGVLRTGDAVTPDSDHEYRAIISLVTIASCTRNRHFWRPLYLSLVAQRAWRAASLCPRSPPFPVGQCRSPMNPSSRNR